MSIARLKDYRGPALFSYGFRPFFFFGSVYAGATILVWLPAFFGTLQLGTAFAPRDWHVHEMLFGYIAAVVAGFLLTAVPNWTGRLPLQGRPLVLLFSTWVAGRIAVSVSAWIGWGPAAAIDSAVPDLACGRSRARDHCRQEVEQSRRSSSSSACWPPETLRFTWRRISRVWRNTQPVAASPW